MTDTELDIMLALPNIQRWQIVETTRPQSVAEHSFRVWALATNLYDILVPVPHNSGERAAMQLWALMHDVDEVITGDIPSTVKKVFEDIQPGIMERFNEKVTAVLLPSVSTMRRGMRGSFGHRVVKIADIVESIMFIKDYGKRPDDVAGVVEDRGRALEALMVDCETSFRLVDWRVGGSWVKSKTGRPWLV